MTKQKKKTLIPQSTQRSDTMRTLRYFANNKPLVTSKVRDTQLEERSFRTKDQEEMQRSQSELKLCLREAKEACY